MLVKEARSIVAGDDVASTTLKSYLGSLPYKRSHLVALRTVKISADNPPSIVEAETEIDAAESVFENDQRIIIHAMDRDRGKVGWAGHIPALFEERVHMKLDKTIDPEALFTKTEIVGDVLIEYDTAEDGKKTPTQFHLLSLGETPKPKRKQAATR